MLIGRKEEKKILQEALEKDESQFIAIYGRRRVGKTYLAKEFFHDGFTFSCAGVYKGKLEDQLEVFSQKLDYYGLKGFEKPKKWMDAFYLLVKLVDRSKEKKKVIFLDELSWFNTRNSGFLKALENLWNSYFALRNDIVLIVCASATSWLIDNVIHNKGGLHNRLTAQINLQPFSLGEVEELVEYQELPLNRKQIIEGYIALGGIPYYWGLLRKDLSLPGNIDFLFAGNEAPLRDENEYLYRSLFDCPEDYLSIVSALSKGKRSGMTRDELLKATKLADNGNFSKRITDLENCGIVRSYLQITNHQNKIIQLMDNFTLFYYKMVKGKTLDEHFFSSSIGSGEYNAWSGLAFERVCLQHAKQIKYALQIGGVKSTLQSLYCKEDPEKGIYGSQIDLLIVRKDEVINLCEMKFSAKPYIVSKEDLEKMEIRKSDLKAVVGDDYSIIPTLVVFPSLYDSANAREFSSVVTGEDLFLK